MKLKLSSAITGKTTQTIIINNLTSNLKLEVPAEVPSIGDLKEFVKGMILLGVLADLTIPLGNDKGFKHIAGTGFFGHVMVAYLLTTAFLLELKIGYIKYETQTSTEVNESGETIDNEDKFSQVPILLGLYYLINTHSAFKPFVSLALGLIIQSYSYTRTYSDGREKIADESNTGFGIAPSVGFYCLLGTVLIELQLEYLHMFRKLEPSYSVNYNLGKVNNSLDINQEDDSSESYSVKSFSINVGVAFPFNLK